MHRTGNFLKRKIFFVILMSIAIAALAFGISACGKGDVSSTSSESGPTGNGNAKDLEYVQRGDEYVVSGIGSYSGTDLVIPSEYKSLPVTAIDDYAFFNNKTLNSVFLPESITYIGGYSFYYCKTLTKVNIPENTTFLGECAFYNCTALEEIYYNATSLDNFTATKRVFDMAGIDGSGITVTIGEGVTEIPAYLFCPDGSDSGNIPKITSIKSEDGSQCTTIGASAFYNCRYLESLTLPENLSSIGSSAFYYCSSLENLYYESSLFTGTLSSYFSNAGRDGDGITVTIGNGVAAIPDSLFSSFTKISDVVFEGGCKCTSIGAQAFSGCTALVSISVPNTVTNIGDSAFNNCSSLSNLTIGSGVTSIGDRAFYNCTSLTTVTIPDSVVSLGEYAFYGCTSLTNVGMGSKITSIGPSAFNSCSSLTSVNLPDGVTEIAANLFYNCSSLSSVEIGQDTASIGYRAFYYCKSLETIKIPGSVTLIDEYAFDGCSSLASVTLSDGLTSIGTGSFRGCSSLTDIVIPDSVTSVGSAAFSGCSSLESITIPFTGSSANATSASSSTLFGNIFGTSSYTGGTSTIQFYSSSSYATYYIPSLLKSVTVSGGNILYGTFYNCSTLTSVTFSDSVSSIDGKAFYGCTSLMAVYIADLATWCSIDFGSETANPLYYNATLYVDNCPVKFEGEFIIPDGVEHIGSYVFYDYIPLVSVTIPSSVTSIGECAFQYCDKLIEVCNLSSMSLTAGSTDNGYVAYYAQNVYTNGESKISTTDDGYIFYNDADSHYLMGCIGSDTSLSLPDNIGYSYEIYEFGFYCNTSLVSVVIPDLVTVIGRYAFAYCESIKSVSISSNVTAIRTYAFRSCTSLTSVSIPESVTTIGSHAFEACTSLKSVTIPESVTSISFYAFYNCTSLTSVYITNLEAWCTIDFASDNSNPLYNGANLYLNGELVTDLVIPESVTTLWGYAFYGCASLTSVTIPASVSSIADDVFYGCTHLTTVYFNAVTMEDLSSNSRVFYNAGDFTAVIGAGVERIPAYLFSYSNIVAIIFKENSQCASIGAYAFSNCTSLTEITIPDSVITINKYAFYSCSSVAALTISAGVASVDEYAFAECTSLTSIVFNAVAMDDMDTYNYVFKNAGKDGEGIILTVGASVTLIPKAIFSPSSSSSPKIINVIFEEGTQCTSIGEYAFYGCTSLTSIIIPDSVTSIGYGAFAYCSSLTTIYYCGNASDWSKISIGTNNGSLTSATIYYYSETEPTEEGDFWHYVNGEVVIWKKDT